MRGETGKYKSPRAGQTLFFPARCTKKKY